MRRRVRTPLSGSARAVVTGAGSGIGRALSVELAARGSAVLCSDRDLRTARETAATIVDDGGRAYAVECDVSVHDQVRELSTAARDLLGDDPNLVINNAGVGAGGRVIGSIGMVDWNWVLGVNLLGVVHGCEVFAPVLRRQRRAGLINIASAAAYTAAPLMGPYSASKAAVLSISETLAAEMGGTGVRVTVVCPTFVATNVARDGRITGAAADFAVRMAERGTSAPEVARRTLDANDRGQLHVMPQAQARWGWRAKRLAPGPVTRTMGFAGRWIVPSSSGTEADDGRVPPG